MSAPKSLEQLGRERPEWRPWLALLVEARAAAAAPAWSDLRLERAPVHTPGTPVLEAATLAVDAGAADRLVRRLLAIAADAATGPVRDVDALALIEGALAADGDRLATHAQRLGLEPAVIAAVAGVAAIPLAQACARAHPETAITWTAPYCPVCGAWPALAEERGLERSRRYRCGTCGTDWWAAWLTCPYCGEAEHERLATLAIDGDGTRRVDACLRCQGYLKTVTLLTAAPDVAALDAETVELDVAARGHGYTRPVTPGYPVRPRVVARPGLARRLLAWTR